MPLLLCPSCQPSAPMQAVVRNGVEFDVCTACRGVWLDRGELEKLLEHNRAALAQPEPERAPYQAPPSPARPAHGQYGERGEYGYGHKRKRGFDLLDFFD